MDHNSPDHKTIYHSLEYFAEHTPENIALLEPGYPALTYRGLLEQVNRIRDTLFITGIQRDDVIAIVLPNGANMAVSFLAVACTAISAPLNPGYRYDEFDYYLSDLNARAVIVMEGNQSPAIQAALQNKVDVFELRSILNEPAGVFNLHQSDQSHRNQAEADKDIKPEQVSLLLHTSGTTARPKIVPLTQGNICASARNIRDWLQISANDRCLNLMPLFHIHGLVAALLSSIHAGASVVCTPGFNIVKFFEWMDQFRPTWYTAVPTMHQSILSRAREHAQVISRTPLRFIRSSSSSLPPQVMRDLETTFHAPVVEAYGMTEASHQMTSNPLPPLPRKPGSVGLPAGSEITILSEIGPAILPQGEKGEIAIRGENVTPGYLTNPGANQKAFSDGWFRTGDLGYLDQDGYLFISGRLKEIINRGGEKIIPREIDEVLMNHPSVQQAITFPVPDDRLGEEIAAAVVLREADITELSLQQFVAQHLADFKIPRRILIVEEIPKGPTGKIQRIGLAEKLNLHNIRQANAPIGSDFIPAQNEIELALTEIWREILGIEKVAVNQRFLDLGGDSILAVQLADRIQEKFGKEVMLVDLFQAETITQQALLLSALPRD